MLVKNEKIKVDSQTIKLVIIYCFLFASFVIKMFFYVNQELTGPDWVAHASYLIYEVEHPNEIIPVFEDIKMYPVKNIFYENEQLIYQMEKSDNGMTCYLGHSPLYYKIIGFFDVVEIDKTNVYLNYTKIGVINIFLTSLAMLLMIYEGYKYLIKKNADTIDHTLFVTIATTLPMYGFLGSQLNNDNLCNLGIACLMIGLFSYAENGYTFKTYLFVALGVVVSMFAKLTAGLIALIVVLCVVIFDVYKNKTLNIVCNKFFVFSIPIYLVVLYYYLKIYITYGNFQPSLAIISPENFYNSNYYVKPELRGELLSLGAGLVNFFEQIIETWISTYSNGWTITREGILLLPYVVTIVLFFVQCIIEGKKYFLKKNKEDIFSFVFGVSLIITLIIHIYTQYNGYLASGYTGGAQSRYYMPCIAMIGLGASSSLIFLKNKRSKMIRKFINIFAVITILILYYADFGYYIMNCYKNDYFY